MKKGGTTSNIQHRTPNIHFLEGLRFKVEGLRQEARGGYAGRRSGGVLRLGQPRSGGRRRWFAGSGFCRFVDVHGWRERQRTAALHNLAGERRPAVA